MNRQTWYVDGVTGHSMAGHAELQTAYDVVSLDGNPFAQLTVHESGVLAATASANGLTWNFTFSVLDPMLRWQHNAPSTVFRVVPGTPIGAHNSGVMFLH